jgi:beta-mannosidase
MGLMYWQLNDIWQAPTWSSIEYGLKWKMAHYYVRNMYSPIYVLMKLKPYLPSVTDRTAQLSLYLVNELVNSTLNQVICTIKSFDTFDARSIMKYDVVSSSAGVQLIDVFSYKLLMEQSRCLNSSQCLMLCSLSTNDQQSTEMQTLFFASPKDYRLYNPNLRTVSVRQRSLTEIDFTINADMPALFVWLDLTNGVSGYFSRNGFHMFEQVITITFKSWTPLTNFDSANFDLRIISLYDVTKL